MFLVIVFLYTISVSLSHEVYSERWLTDGSVVNVPDKSIELLDVFCHEAETISVIRSFKSFHVLLNVGSEDYQLFGGENVSSVTIQHDEHTSSWFNIFPWRRSTVNIPVFGNYCIGILTQEAYDIRLSVRMINYWMLLQLLTGIGLFFMAKSLSRNVLFYYASGISIGLVASLLVLVFVVSRFVPKKAGAYAVLLFGWSMVLYSCQLLFDNIYHVFAHHGMYVLLYLVSSALISFAVCYKYGPVDDVKTLNLIQWFLQMIAVTLIFFSSEYREVSTSIIIVVISTYNIPSSWIARLRTRWHVMFPPKIKLLTEEEFIQQSSIETKKALDHLRRFCKSPKCNAWYTMTRLKTPMRFASFIEGSSHLTDDEMMLYDYDVHTFGSAEETAEDSNLLTEDSDS